VLLRFSDILRSRIEALSERFENAIKEYEYAGAYTTVYPIKVNQQRHVVEEIVQFGNKHGVGLECGSKPELQAVLGLAESTEHLIVCNGYKDEEFMRLALMGQKLGHQVFIVIEQLSEIDVLLSVADELGVTPNRGHPHQARVERLRALEGERRREVQVRSQRRAAHAGGGQAARRRPPRHREADPLPPRLADHRHPVHQVRAAGGGAVLRRAAGAREWTCTHVDVGGGLGVDYDGTNSTSNASVNYSLQEYANDVIYTLAEACRSWSSDAARDQRVRPRAHGSSTRCCCSR
jgi:arginine decarboxylase